MKTYSFVCSAALIFVLVLSGPVAAEVLYQQRPANVDESESLRSNLNVGPGTFEYEQQIADDFTPSVANSIGRVVWEGFYFQTSLPANKPTVEFTIQLYTSMSEAPILSEQVQAAWELVGSGNFGSPFYRFTANLASPVAVPAGQLTWIAVLESDADTSRDFRWSKTDQEEAGQFAIKQAGPWYIFDSDYFHDFVFSLESTNQRPIANAGLDRAAAVGETVFMNGGASSDVETATSALHFSWSIVSAPDGSLAELESVNTVTPSLMPDVPGEYVLELEVTDAQGLVSTPSPVSILAEIDGGLLISTLATGFYEHESIHLLFEKSQSDQIYALDFDYGYVTGLRYSHTYQWGPDFGFLTYESANTIVTVDELRETRIVGVGDLLDGTSSFAWLGSAYGAADGKVRFTAAASSGNQVIEGVFESQHGQINALMVPPVAVFGAPDLKGIWDISGVDPGSLFMGRDGTYQTAVRNGTSISLYHTGIYRRAGNGALRIADTSTSVPGHIGSFLSFGSIDQDPAGNVYFVGYWYNPAENNWSIHSAVFRSTIDGTVELLSDPDDLSLFRIQVDGDRVLVGGFRTNVDQLGRAMWEIGVFSLQNNTYSAEITDRVFSLGKGRATVDPWSWSVRNGIVSVQVSYFDQTGEYRKELIWGENGRSRSVMDSAKPIGDRQYDHIYVSGNRFVDGRAFVITGREVLENSWSFDPETQDYSATYREESDLLLARFDSDRDQVADDNDNCPLRPNPNQTDSDDNGVGDVCEDTDEDGSLDPDDNCPFVANPGLVDSDGDSIGDDCDVCPLDVDPDQGDSDGDGIGNACDNDKDEDGVADDLDNCPFLANFDQANLDGDREGDVCDSDMDGDGILNLVDGRIEGGAFIDESAMASTNFSDHRLGGRSFGQIVSSGQLILQVSDSPNVTGGVLVSAFSGTGQAKIKQCAFKGKNAQVTIDQGTVVEITCGSIHVKPFVNRALLELDDDVVIDIPQNTTASVLDTNTQDFLVRNPPESVFPLQVSLGDQVQVTVNTSSAAAVSSPAEGFYVVENLEDSLQAIVVEIDGVAETVVPGTSVTSQFVFSGFFPPVDNPPILNKAKAGSSIPVKFSLGGNQGLEIFATGYPKSQVMTCPGSTASAPIEETVSGSASGLSYDAASDTYTYVWKTTKTWTNCRQLKILLIDGQTFDADFHFVK